MNRQLYTDKPAKQLQLKLLLNKGHQDRQFDELLLCTRLSVCGLIQASELHPFIHSLVYSFNQNLFGAHFVPALHEDEAFVRMELTL